MNKYEQWLKERIAKIEKFRYEDIERLGEYPSETAQQVLRELIKNACDYCNSGIKRKDIRDRTYI